MTAASSDQKSGFKLYPHGTLAILGTVAVYMVYSNLFSGPPGAPADARPRATAPAATVVPGSTEQSGSRRTVTRARNEEFHPVLHSKRPEDRIDPFKIDPTLKLELLKKVMAVSATGGSRNLFAFGQPPKPAETLKGPEPRIAQMYGPPVAPPPPIKIDPADIPPSPLPFTIKFYGFSMVRANGKKSGYFLDGDDIVILSEGDMLKRRYKIVRIGPNAVMLEDSETKRQQSLAITPDGIGS